VASLASYLAVWMQSVAGAWLMTSLTSSRTAGALMQPPSALPMFLLSLPAGVLADLLGPTSPDPVHASAAAGPRVASWPV